MRKTCGVASLVLTIILSVSNMGHSPDLTHYHGSMPLVVAMSVPRILEIAVLILAAPPQVLILIEISQVVNLDKGKGNEVSFSALAS